MTKTLNMIKNPAFTEGKKKPLRWDWGTTDESVVVERPNCGDGITIRCDNPVELAMLSQTVTCKPDEFYRVEATVSCELQGRCESSGLVLTAQPFDKTKPAGEKRITNAITIAYEPFTVRGYIEVPEGARRLAIEIGLEHACGSVTIHRVAVLGVLEPEETSHLIAFPAPGYSLPAPRVAKSVALCSTTAEDRPLTGILRTVLGRRNVTTIAPSEFSKKMPKSDAVLLPDDAPPVGVRSMTALMKLAEERIVVISTTAFATLSRGSVRVRRVEQEDDPICAKVVFANHATRGFALHDMFPYAGSGAQPGGFAQNQFRTGADFSNFCKRHHLITLLNSMCNQDSTSDKPICLYRETPHGGLFVLDIEPVECVPTSSGDPTMALYFLRNTLGHAQHCLGQYAAPIQEEYEIRDIFREMNIRFPEFVEHSEDVPAREITSQLITIGREDAAFGLPLRQKPVILIRSGLHSGDAESVYGSFYWFKQLVRMPPHTCPYGESLASKFRLAWAPIVAGWDGRYGWRRGHRAPLQEMEIEAEEGAFAALIDVVSVPFNRARVVIPASRGGYQRYAQWLPTLQKTFSAGDYYAYAPPFGETFSDRTKYAWRPATPPVAVDVDDTLFDTEAHRQARACGAELVRIEVPGHDADFTSHSIHRTDLTASLIEWVVGLQYGLVAANRTNRKIRCDGFQPVVPGSAVVVDRDDMMLRTNPAKVG